MCVCVENLIILLMIGVGWAFNTQLGELCSLWIKVLLRVTVYFSRMCGFFGDRVAVEPRVPQLNRSVFFSTVPLPSAVSRLCSGWCLRALPWGFQPPGVPIHSRRRLHRGRWDAVKPAFSPRS